MQWWVEFAIAKGRQDEIQDGDVQELDRGRPLPIRQQMPVRSRGTRTDGQGTSSQQHKVQIQNLHHFQ